MSALCSNLRQETGALYSDLRQETTEGFATLRQALADQRFEMLRWAFLFWVGQFFAVASLVAVLIRFLRPGRLTFVASGVYRDFRGGHFFESTRSRPRPAAMAQSVRSMPLTPGPLCSCSIERTHPRYSAHDNRRHE
jgi:hypothetical protein